MADAHVGGAGEKKISSTKGRTDHVAYRMRVKAKMVKPHCKGAHHQPFALRTDQRNAAGGGKGFDQPLEVGRINGCRGFGGAGWHGAVGQTLCGLARGGGLQHLGRVDCKGLAWQAR